MPRAAMHDAVAQREQRLPGKPLAQPGQQRDQGFRRIGGWLRGQVGRADIRAGPVARRYPRSDANAVRLPGQYQDVILVQGELER